MFCHFCRKNIDDVDYKDIELLAKFISGFYKIKPRKKTGLCSHHQKKISTAIKRARQMAMLPYMPR
ncbi:MAG: 30S ribosomal protein S18 [Candidatus Staskawiczbacteria bacterium RIFCSPLOWO2_01_FULL_38_12b]|uniref:Small ribosomal subunit protein bS18 n=1 Tax=Candidatus Staskawiczbacteria bacterium RIFCSPLOWO2_01_FULL_38_12b TaxID=1802214 RepID=A0A1G2ICA5_9BACT|nr:MAG: 30S ribosomal protein S18 [Candidatus Staskawiczbacteria bacterium RIFCSPLOWO2_01_FULL_38_12b]